MPRAEQIAKPAEWDATRILLAGFLYPYSEGCMSRGSSFLIVRRPVGSILVFTALLACSERSTPPPMAPTFDRSVAANHVESGDGSHAPATLAWENTARVLLAAHPVPPIVGARFLALHSVAQYAGVAAVAGEDRRDGDHASTAAVRGAIAGASARILTFLLPTEANTVEAQVTAEGTAITGPAHADFTRGVEAGRSAAEAVVVFARNDGYAHPDGSPWIWDESMRNASGPGIWEGAPAPPTIPPAPPAKRPPPIGFQFPAMTPYFLRATHHRTAQSQFRPKAPPTYTTDQPNSPFETALREVRYISDHRTAAQIATANLWNGRGIGYWGEQAAKFIDERHLDEREAAHIHALMYASVMDAVIGCWEAKFHYLFLRPIMADPGITLVFAMPNHPSYPSGHSCVSSSAAAVLSYYFPSHAEDLEAQVVDAGWSRIYAGIHYRFDIEAGQKLGRSTADWAIGYDRRRGLLTAVGLGGPEEEEEHERR